MAEKFTTLRARLGAHAMHAKHDSRETSQPARDAFLRRFEVEVIEAAQAKGEDLDPIELHRRAQHALKAHVTRLALKSAQARRKGGAK
jgi:hypothetical protein